ncbi:substrate-binding domain-containing protein [Paracoccus seriniphilus]|uniref:Monosaccharide ABC transporter substrate-binding protein, CUT2 family n=1 Tax=Paracoccus seriniphilus TaxID=184748 RepID=A0A239PUL3_9RHOB|nr:substrate-binding domain-containing protein [Paracoccus seriniphilus]WCR15496.1 substrate-binding domain-containing protein [Paracoccus seriniphilus]SNT73991.1 monosaccharide ABC transporter substrate-binding protein, CUT2 family [Paracoccus seriniphilus]
MKKITQLAGSAAFCASLVAGAAMAQDAQSISTVVKVTGENWFIRMNEGVDQFNADNEAIEAAQVGPAQADAAQQARIIEDLVARGVSAIAVVPMDPSALEGVLRRAKQRGIKVIAHEGDSIVNADADIEAFDNAAFGTKINEGLADCMGGEGKWTSFVGSLGSLTHNQWVEAGAENAGSKYPGMELVAEKNESFNDANRAYERAKEILRAHPDIKGFQGSSAIDVIGIGRAVEEAGLEDKTCVFGLGLPKDTGPYLETGAVDRIYFWDPKDAGYVMNVVSKMILDGTEITNGMDLGVPGYNEVTVSDGPGKGIIIQGQAWVDVGKDDYAEYPF